MIHDPLPENSSVAFIIGAPASEIPLTLSPAPPASKKVADHHTRIHFHYPPLIILYDRLQARKIGWTMKAQPSVRLRVMDGAMRILRVGDLTYGARPQRGSGPPATPHAGFIWKEVEIIEEPLPLNTH